MPPLLLCMFGTDVFEGILPTIRGKPIQGKKVEIKYLAHATDLDPEECYFLFSSGSKREQGQEFVTMLKELPVLTVRDME